MNKLRYTFIFLILISLFPCHGLLADEKTNNITENVTETVSTSTTENESEENHVNIKPQKKENIFIQIMKWLGFIISIAVIAGVIGVFFYQVVLENSIFLLKDSCYFGHNVDYEEGFIAFIIAIIYFILAIVLKASFKISFFWSAIITLSIVVPVAYLIVFIIDKRNEAEYYDIIEVLSRKLLHANLERIHKRSELCMFIDDGIEFCKENYEKIRDRIIEIRRQEAEIQRLEAEIQKQKALEQIQNDAAEQAKANEDAMRKNEVERNIDELGDYIDMLGESIQKKELPKTQIVSELSKMLDSIFNNKSYISKEGFNKVRNDNEVFIKHILGKCPELEKFSGTLLETRMEQVKEKFKQILK